MLNMFGSEYTDEIDVVLGEFGAMTKQYKKMVKTPSYPIFKSLQRLYVKVFGIPEIGFQIRALYFKDMLGNLGKKPQNILDAGSGIGTYAFYLAKIFPNAHIIGCDNDRRKLRFCERFKKKHYNGNLSFVYCDLEKGNLGQNMYDLIINIDVLEHIRGYKRILRNFFGALKPNGLLYIHTPQSNQTRFFSALKGWHHENHAREGFSSKALHEELTGIGFEILYQKNTHGFFGSLAWETFHIALSKNLFFAGLIYPFLYLLARLDMLVQNQKGLSMAILAQRPRQAIIA